MDTPHVVKVIEFPRKAIAGYAAVAAVVHTDKGFVTMAVHPVGFSFMSK
jgi:hypothetical protein